MKYLLLTEGTAYYPELLKPFERAGLYNWMKAFDGEVRLWGDIRKRPHELKDYDVVHVNSYGQDMGLAAVLEAKLKEFGNTKTKILVNMDIAVNYFDANLNLGGFLADIKAADCLFGVEPTQVNLVNYLTRAAGRKKPGYCALMPHPVNVSMLMDEAFVPYNERMDVVAFQYHTYDGHWNIPRMLMLDLPEGYLGAMLGYIKKDKDPPVDMRNMTHLLMPYMEWDKYIRFLARCKVGFEYRTHKAASRFVMEAGALGIPVVTTKDSHMGQLIFPDICHDVGDYFGIRGSLERLITDEKYRLKLARLGMERLEKYNFENSKNKMMVLINNVGMVKE